MRAIEVIAAHKAGLILAGYMDGEYQWMGSASQWAKKRFVEDYYDAMRVVPSLSYDR